MDVHAGRLYHAADVDGEDVVRQLGSIGLDRDPQLRIEGHQSVLVEFHTEGAGQRPHIDPPRVRGQRARGRRRGDTAVIEESRGKEGDPIAGGSQLASTLHDMKVRVASADQEQDWHLATSATRPDREG